MIELGLMSRMRQPSLSELGNHPSVYAMHLVLISTAASTLVAANLRYDSSPKTIQHIEGQHCCQGVPLQPWEI